MDVVFLLRFSARLQRSLSYSLHWSHHQSLPAKDNTVNQRQGSCINRVLYCTRSISRTTARNDAGYSSWQEGDQGWAARRSMDTREGDTGNPRGRTSGVADAHWRGVHAGGDREWKVFDRRMTRTSLSRRASQASCRLLQPWVVLNHEARALWPP